MSKKIEAKVQEFRPKQLRQIIKTAEGKNSHPNLEDIKRMAEDTIKNAPCLIHDEKARQRAIDDAKKTITDVERAQKEGKESHEPKK
jgi:hypothetical protein